MVKGPKYDRSHFIVTTDGCKDGFARVLAQRFEWVDKKGIYIPRYIQLPSHQSGPRTWNQGISHIFLNLWP